MAEIINLPGASPELSASRQAAPAWLRTGALTIAATALVALCAHVAVPLFFTPVPITLQTLAVLFFGLLLGPRWAFATLGLYLVEGVSGLPVFSPHGPGGLLQLSGPTGGYLLSYPFAAALAGWVYQQFSARLDHKFFGARLASAFSAAFLASLVILAVGATWFGLVTHQPAHAVAAQAVLPFLPGDFVKVCLAASAVTGIHRIQRIDRIDRIDRIHRPSAA